MLLYIQARDQQALEEQNQPLQRVAKNDIRRHLPKMILNTLNCSDFMKILSNLNGLMRPDCKFRHEHHIKKSEKNKLRQMSAEGPLIAAFYITAMGVMYPDMTHTFTSSKLITSTKQSGSQLIVEGEFECTQIYDISVRRAGMKINELFHQKPMQLWQCIEKINGMSVSASDTSSSSNSTGPSRTGGSPESSLSGSFQSSADRSPDGGDSPGRESPSGGDTTGQSSSQSSGDAAARPQKAVKFLDDERHRQEYRAVAAAAATAATAAAPNMAELTAAGAFTSDPPAAASSTNHPYSLSLSQPSAGWNNYRDVTETTTETGTDTGATCTESGSVTDQQEQQHKHVDTLNSLEMEGMKLNRSSNNGNNNSNNKNNKNDIETTTTSTIKRSTSSGKRKYQRVTPSLLPSTEEKAIMQGVVDFFQKTPLRSRPRYIQSQLKLVITMDDSHMITEIQGTAQEI